MEDKKSFWSWAKVTHSLKRNDPGVEKYRLKYDFLLGTGKFRRFRRYKGPGGEVKRTVEIEI